MTIRKFAQTPFLLICIAGSASAQSDPSFDALNRTVIEFYAAGRYAAGLPVAAYAVQLAERTKGPTDPSVATALNNYGQFLVRANRAKEAETAFRQALAIDESAGPDARNVAQHINNLASLLQSSQRGAEAEKLYVRALAIDERTLGPQHRDVARDLNNIAVLLRDRGMVADAEHLQRRAIEILENLRRENPGGSNLDLASALSNLAAELPRDSAAEAETLYRRALELDENELGSQHPNVAVTLNNLAETLRLSGKSDEAEVLFRRALDIDERVLGAQNPNVATVLNNLAKVLRDTNRPAEAESLFNRALAIDQTSFGPMHPAVARDLKNLAKFFKVWNRGTEALPIMQRVIDILQFMERKSGSPVLELGPAFNYRAQILEGTDQLKDAEIDYRNALALDEKNYGTRSAQVVSDLTGLGRVLNATQRAADAAEFLRRADDIATSAKAAKAKSASREPKRCSGFACEAKDGI